MAPKKKRIPTKSELVQLQKLYKTDEKIGERLGGVPAYLVAYWRRKKNVPKHSQPKFSEKEILTLWERFGDDDKCGMELGISKAAFYNWRRRYNIKEKPAFLKLEQLELNFPGLKLNSGSISLYNKQTVAQKIFAEKVDSEQVEVGNEYEVEPDMVISNGDLASLFKAFEKLDTDLVWNPNKICISLSDSKNKINKDPETKKLIRDFVKRQGIKNIYDSSIGSCHQVALEKGHILPGQVVIGVDNYVSSFGSLSVYATQKNIEQLASVWSTGKTKIKIPSTIRVNISGRRSRGVYGLDIALSVLQQLKTQDMNGKAVEFYGNVISQMSISERYVLCNLTRDLGAETAICPFDSVTRRYLTGRTLTGINPVIADKNAEYDEVFQINIDQLPPLAGNYSSSTIKAAAEYEGLPLNVIILGTSNNGRFNDLRAAAEILKGRKVADDLRFYVVPSTRTVYIEALKKGLIRVLVEAGAILLFPGEHSLFDPSNPILAEGERALVTANKSLFGSLDASKNEIYTASPATAAASAINGQLTDPVRYLK